MISLRSRGNRSHGKCIFSHYSTTAVSRDRTYRSSSNKTATKQQQQKQEVEEEEEGKGGGKGRGGEKDAKEGGNINDAGRRLDVEEGRVKKKKRLKKLDYYHTTTPFYISPIHIKI